MSDKDGPQLRVVDRRWWARGETDEPGGDPGGRKPTVIEELEQQLADKTAQLQTFLTDHRRALEEFEQVKARIRRDTARDVERGKRSVIAEFLDVLDNLDRAIAAAASHPDNDAALLTGVRLVRDQFLGKLQGLGVMRLDAIGQPFDADDEAFVSALVAAGHASTPNYTDPQYPVMGRVPRTG